MLCPLERQLNQRVRLQGALRAKNVVVVVVVIEAVIVIIIVVVVDAAASG